MHTTTQREHLSSRIRSIRRRRSFPSATRIITMRAFLLCCLLGLAALASCDVSPSSLSDSSSRRAARVLTWVTGTF